ncbi:MAG TPA: FtsQ-type POTRA domain-containing protein [Deltaproteobacteria bacterium]|jgi:cell division protein FtsQ|nr:FtsQ-type POTRA domain-containing protein [Deltaproteobacteria bacterium]
MIKPRKKRRNRYQEGTLRRLKGYLRTFHGFFIVFALFCFVVLLAAGLSRLYHEMISAPWFKLEEIEITGIKQLDRFDILNAMGLKRGQCTLNISTEQVAERLKKLPAVREASLRIDLSGRIVVEIVEREPAAIVKCADKNMQMDLDGILFSEATPGANGALPLITGFCGSNPNKGDPVAARTLEQIRELLSAIDSSKNWLSGTAINECRWSENGFTLVLGERAVLVDIGKGAFEQKITKLRKVINTLNERDWTDLVTRIDLDYPGKAYLEGRFPVPQPAQGRAKQPG